MNPVLNQYAKMARFLSEVLGSSFEAVLFDLTAVGAPLAAPAYLRQSNLDRLRECVLEGMKNPRTLSRGYYANHAISMSLDNISKISVFYITDAEEEVVGALCLNMECNTLFKMQNYLSSVLQFSTDDVLTREERPDMQLREPSLDSIAEIVEETVGDPTHITADERIEVIVELYDAGVFTLKGAVARTAEVLHVSEQSVYRYLARIRKVRS